jgi:iron-sulfur cluster assembly accessory protein
MDAPATSTPIIELTPSAAVEVKALLQKTENENKFLRVYVEEGGCSGLQYSMIFDEKRPDDTCAEAHGVTILVDELSSTYLRGARVDYSDSLSAGGFKISNPNASQSCGCGKSFTA